MENDQRSRALFDRLWRSLWSCPLQRCIASHKRIGPGRARSGTIPRQGYTEKINKTYSFPFGKGHIALPGNAAVEGGGFLNKAFSQRSLLRPLPPAGISRMAPVPPLQLVPDPLLQQERGDSGSDKGIAYARYCDSCHNPIAVLSGAMNRKSTVDRSFDSDGLTCMTCHSIQSVEPKLGNGSYVMASLQRWLTSRGIGFPALCRTQKSLPTLTGTQKP